MSHLTFKDLKFDPHPVGDGLMARMEFKNGYGISVVRFKIPSIPGFRSRTEYGSYTNNEKEWEAAVTKGGNLCYDTPITDDVVGHLSEADVTALMAKIQDLS